MRAWLFASAAGGAAIVTGLAGGRFGDILKAAAIAGVTAFAFDAVGELTNHQPAFAIAEHLENIAGHAVVGCASAVAQGGQCGPAALSGAVGSFAGPFVNTLPFQAALVANAALGGVASIAAGGRFENGAITGAFGYLFNACGGPHGCAFWGGAIGTGVGLAASAACDAGSAGVCAPANPEIVVASGAAGASAGAILDTLVDNVHANSADSMRGTELYYLINNDTGDIDKIGITSYPDTRYSQAYLAAENVRYVPQAYYTWRYAAMVDENIRLTFYQIENGELPRLNKVAR